MRQQGLFGSFVAAAIDLPMPEDTPEVLKHLVNLVAKTVAQAQRRPLHFNVPFREPLAPETMRRGPVIDLEPTTFVAPKCLPNLEQVLPLLERAERGIIVCGPRERADGFGALVHALGRHLGFPVLTEAASNARYGFEDAITMYDQLSKNEHFSRARPDLMLRFGGGLTAKSMINLSAPITILVSEDGAVIDPLHAAQLVLDAPAEDVCQALLTGLKARPTGAWLGPPN